MGLPRGYWIQISREKSYLCPIRSRQNYLSRHHTIISYLSRLPDRKIKKLPVPWLYLIPFPAIIKPFFPTSRLKKRQIPRPEKALLGPLTWPWLAAPLDIPVRRTSYSIASCKLSCSSYRHKD